MRLAPVTLALLGCLLALPAAAQSVNVYSSRGEPLIKTLLDQFTARSGVEVNLVTGKSKALMQRLRAEGRNSPADVLLTSDAGNLVAARAAGLFQPVDSPALRERIPARLRDPENHWFGLSQRARVLVYHPGRAAAAPARYADLAAPAWAGRVCARSSSNIYNQSLLAAMIAHDGVEQAEAWARAVRANMARRPQGNDRAQILAVAAGECDVALVNSYYLGVMLGSGDAAQREAAEAVVLVYPDQDGRGAHVNVSGAGVSAHAPNRDNAVALLEFLAGDEAQRWYAQSNSEFPAVPGVALGETVASWGEFSADPLPVATLGERNAEAVRAFDRAGWE